MLYDRKTISVVLSDANVNDQQVDVFAYVLGSFKGHLLNLPFLSSFTQEHAQQYRPKHDRETDQNNIRSYVKN